MPAGLTTRCLTFRDIFVCTRHPYSWCLPTQASQLTLAFKRGVVTLDGGSTLIYGLFQESRVLAQDGVSRAAKPARVARFTLDAPEHSGTIPGARGDILTPGVALTSNLAVIFTLNQHTLRPARRAVAEFIYHYHGGRNHQGLGNAFVFLNTTPII